MLTKLGLFPCLLLIVVASTSGQTVTSPDQQAAKASALKSSETLINRSFCGFLKGSKKCTSRRRESNPHGE